MSAKHLLIREQPDDRVPLPYCNRGNPETAKGLEVGARGQYADYSDLLDSNAITCRWCRRRLGEHRRIHQAGHGTAHPAPSVWVSEDSDYGQITELTSRETESPNAWPWRAEDASVKRVDSALWQAYLDAEAKSGAAYAAVVKAMRNPTPEERETRLRTLAAEAKAARPEDAAEIEADLERMLAEGPS